MVKRYIAEPGSDDVRGAMREADGWFICRTGFVETVRAVGLAAGWPATKAVRNEWPAFGIVEVDQALAERAAALAVNKGLRSLDAMHLAAALLLRIADMTFATWDSRLHAAARSEGLRCMPAKLP